MSFAVWGCAPARHRAFFAGASVPRVSRARSGTWTPRGRRPRLGAVAILRPDLPQPPREPTWQDRLENLKEYGENDGPLGRKNRGPRRRIRRTVSKPRIAPNSVDDKIRAWNESPGVSPPSEPSPASTSSNAIPASATPRLLPSRRGPSSARRSERTRSSVSPKFGTRRRPSEIPPRAPPTRTRTSIRSHRGERETAGRSRRRRGNHPRRSFGTIPSRARPRRCVTLAGPARCGRR